MGLAVEERNAAGHHGYVPCLRKKTNAETPRKLDCLTLGGTIPAAI
jgi:hypothetical protein